MSKHPFRKAIGLTALYSIIIIGIFVLQFRNESVILRNIGLLRMSVAQTQDSQGNMSLKNTVQVTFKGISFTADDVHPAIITTGSTTQGLTLVSWEQPNPLSYKFNFTYDTSLLFTVSDTSSKASLTVTAQIPAAASKLTLYYKPVSGYSVTEQSKTRQLFSSKNVSYTMAASSIADTSIDFTRGGNIAMYTRYDPAKTFTFASIPSDSETAKASTFENTLKTYRANILSAAAAAFGDSSTLSESAVSAYVAEMASQGNYSGAIENVPDSFKKGTRRTYFSAPYFNSLASMNASLVMANENFASMIKNAVAQKSTDIFAVANIGDYILRSSNKTLVSQLVSLPSQIADFQPTLSQATGILRTYTTLSKANSDYAATLSAAVDKSLKAIAAACSISSDNLIVKEGDSPAGFYQAIETGTALIDYGKFTSSQDYCSGGYMIVNTAFAQNPSADLRSLADVYPFLVTNNTTYPHSLVVYIKNPQPVWAWTCAGNITYEETENGREASIVVNFKQGDTQYIILNGIRPFTGIEIYGLSFHTDPRFESYNSSGYVYNEATHTLFLKSRHKVSNEKIHLYFRNGPEAEPKPVESKPAAPASTPAAPAASNAPENAASSTPAPAVTQESAPAAAAAPVSTDYTPIPETTEE